MISLISALAPIVGDIVKEAIPDPDKKRDAENKVRLALLENSKQLEFNIHKLYKDLSKNEIDILWNGKGPFKGINKFFK